MALDTSGLRWPEGARTTGLRRGEQKRERRQATYIVWLRYRTNDRLHFSPATVEQFTRDAVGSAHVIRREGGRTFVDGAAINPLK